MMAKLKNFPEVTEEKKDLGIKVGTKEQKIWTELKKKTEVMIDEMEKALLVNKEILALCNDKIKKEMEKFK